MAVLVDLQSHALFEAELRKLDVATLMAQQCSQQGAIHAVCWLLKNGVTTENASGQLASLRGMAQLMRAEFRRRRVEDPFPDDQTGFS